MAADNAKKAYDLRDRVSERERYRISAFYFQYVTGEVEKATEAYELWAKSYPRDMVPHVNLGVIYSALGQYDKAIAETEIQQRLEPSIVGYGNLAGDYVNVNRLKDARQTLQEAQQKNFDGLTIRADLYSLAFLSGDSAEMERRRGVGVLAAPAKKTRCSTSTPIPRPTMDTWKKRATSPAVPPTPPCVPMPRKPAPSGSLFRVSARRNSATWLPLGKPLPAP